jgi:hypothetical protein
MIYVYTYDMYIYICHVYIYVVCIYIYIYDMYIYITMVIDHHATSWDNTTRRGARLVLEASRSQRPALCVSIRKQQKGTFNGM